MRSVEKEASRESRKAQNVDESGLREGGGKLGKSKAAGGLWRIQGFAPWPTHFPLSQKGGRSSLQETEWLQDKLVRGILRTFVQEAGDAKGGIWGRVSCGGCWEYRGSCHSLSWLFGFEQRSFEWWVVDAELAKEKR